MNDFAHLNAWCDYPHVDVPHAKTGPLAGLTLAVKDIFQVVGYPNGWGSPSRLAESEPDTETMSAVQKMLDAGAEVRGKSQCEELCFSLTGINAHYGAPFNSAAPDRVTGGSSSGSVSLVTAGVVDIATGSDTGGSVRAPASYCGLIGLRTTYDRIALDRTMPLGHTFDVFGWFTRDAATYQKVGRVVMDDDPSDEPLTRLIHVEALDEMVLGAEEARVVKAGRNRVANHFASLEHKEHLHRPIDDWYWTFREMQAFEAWENLGGWITRAKPDLGPGVKERFEFGSKVSPESYRSRVKERTDMTGWLEYLLGADGCLLLPTVPSCAPLKTDTNDDLQEFREQAIRLLCLSGISGLPQITLPLESVHNAPFGISLIGPRNSDQRLIALAREIVHDQLA